MITIMRGINDFDYEAEREANALRKQGRPSKPLSARVNAQATIVEPLDELWRSCLKRLIELKEENV